MIRKTFEFDIKEVDQTDGRAYFEGYASTFGNLDHDRDIIEHGAWSESLKKNAGKFPVFLDHNYSILAQVGWNVSATENKTGLKVRAELNTETEAGKTAYSLMKQASQHGIKMGLSVGFLIPKGGYDYDEKKEIRHIKKAELYEYSIVSFGANPKAGVTSVKDLKDPKEIAIKKREIEAALRDVGVSKNDAQKAVSVIFAKSQSEAAKEFLKLLNV